MVDMQYGRIVDGNGRRFQLRDGLVGRESGLPVAAAGEWGTLQGVDRGLYITYVIRLDSGPIVRVEPMDVREEGEEDREP